MNPLKTLIPNQLKSRLKTWMLKRQLASPNAAPKTLGGHFRVKGYRAFVQQERYVLGPPEINVAEFMAENIWQGYTCVDVGAHFGYYTLLMALYAGDSGHIYAFEPQDDARAILQKNLSINNLQQVEVLPQVVAEKTGKVPWEDNRLLTTSHIGKPTGQHQIWKPSISLDDFFARRRVIPQIIKIDVEGNEIDVLNGTKQSLAEYKPKLIIEVHHSIIGDEGVSQLWHLLDSIEYEIYGWRLQIMLGHRTCRFRLSDPCDYVGAHICAIPAKV